MALEDELIRIKDTLIELLEENNDISDEIYMKEINKSLKHIKLALAHLNVN